VKAFAKEALTVELKGKESLMNEINVMRSLDHNCLMKLYEVFESDNSFYLVIEHLEGGQLFEKLNVFQY
jgi:serine/threonine protein kinase